MVVKLTRELEAPYRDIAEADPTQIEAISRGVAGTGCLSGLAATPSGLDIVVAAGTYEIAGVVVATAGATKATTPDGSLPRWALTTGKADGSIAIYHGAPSSGSTDSAGGPAEPDIPAGEVSLWSAYLPAGASSLTADLLQDRRQSNELAKRVGARLNGTLIGTRKAINIITANPGDVVGTDNAAADRVDYDFSQFSTVGGGSGGLSEVDEDTPVVAGQPITLIGGRRNDGNVVTTDTDGDATIMATDSAGRPKIVGDFTLNDYQIGSEDETTIQPVITLGSTSAYAVGQSLVSGAIQIVNAGRATTSSGELRSIALVDTLDIRPALNLLFFNAPILTAITHHVVPPWNAADKIKFVGLIQVPTALFPWVTVGGWAFLTLHSIAKILKQNGTQNLYLVITVASGAPAWSSTSALGFSFDMKRN